MAQILVIGASSGIGLETVKAGLAKGHTIRAFSRSADKIAIDDPKLEKQPGDALKADDVAAALEGCDAVIQALGVPANMQMLTGPVTLFSEATDVLVPAMEAKGPKRLIAVTGFGAGDSKAEIDPLQRIGFRLVFGRAYADKSLQEERIKGSALEWTIVRPTVLLNGPAKGSYRIGVKPHEWRNGMIRRADVADFMVAEVDNPRHLHQAPVLRY